MQEPNHNWCDRSGVRLQSVQELAQDFRIGTQDQVESASTIVGNEEGEQNRSADYSATDYDGPSAEETSGHAENVENPKSPDISFSFHSQSNCNPGGYFVYTLDAPTSGYARRGEDSLTYLNKDQYYTLQLEYVSYPQASGDLVHYITPELLTSLVSLQFPQKEKQSKSEALRSWELWASRQPCTSLQAINVLSRIAPNHVRKVQECAYNAVRVTWCPSYGPVQVKIAVKCLSTDFSNQKGVKGIPLYLQIDTYESQMLRDRAVAQIKTFCDKGADRKSREEERRLVRQPQPYPCQQAKSRTVFNHISNVVNEPVLFGPKSEANELSNSGPFHQSASILSAPIIPTSFSQREMSTPTATTSIPHSTTVTLGTFNTPSLSSQTFANSIRNKKPVTRTISNPVIPPPVFLFVRQENEEIYTPICLLQPTLEGMIMAISAKYQIEVGDIRHVYKRTFRGAIIYVDTDFVVGLAGSFFLMKVLVVEGTGVSLASTFGNFNPRLLYDIVLCEMARPPHLI